jgi:hypothetical protein
MFEIRKLNSFHCGLMNCAISKHVRGFRPVLKGYRLVIVEMLSRLVPVYQSCESTMDLDTVCISRRLDGQSLFCLSVEIKVHKIQILKLR